MRIKILTSALIVLFVISIIPVLAEEGETGGVDLMVTIVTYIEEVPADTPTTIDASVEAGVVLKDFNSTEPATVTISLYEENPHPEVEVPPESPMVLGIYLEITANVTEFTTEIRVYYTDDEVEATGIDEESLRLYYFDGTDWVPCEDTGVDTDENFIWARVTHFTLFSPFGAPPNQPPIADAGGPYSGRPNIAIEFDGTYSDDPDGEISSYAWNFGDGGTGTGPQPSHTYSSTGTFTVNLTVTDGDGLTDSDTTTVTVSTPPPSGGGSFIVPSNEPPVAEAGSDRKVYVDVTIHFTGAGSHDPDGTINEYHWFFGDGGYKSGVKVTHIYEEAGNYTASLSVTDNNGATNTDNCTVTVHPMPAEPQALIFETIPANHTEYVIDALDAANTTVTVNTTDTVTVTIIKYESNPHPEDPMPDTGVPKYADIFISDPDAVDWPIYVEMLYTDDEVEGLDEASLGIYYWFNGTWQRCSDTGVDTERNVVWAYMTAEEASGSPILMGGIPTIIIPPLPPMLANLTITPDEVELGDNVTISFDIENIDSQSFTYIVTMKIGELTLLVDVELEAYGSKTVSRTIAMDTVGDFNVIVDGLTGSFIVVVPLPIPTPPIPPILSNLTITPAEIELGEEIVVSFTVTNIDSQSFVYLVLIQMEDISLPVDVELEAYEPTFVSETLTPETVGEYEVTVDGLTGIFLVKAPPKPAEFVCSDLEVTPVEVEEGLTVVVTVDVSNVGEESGSHTVELMVNGTETGFEEVTIEGGSSVIVLFELTRDEGTYQVEVEGMTDSFTVLSQLGAPPTWMRPGYIAGILIVIIAASAIIYASKKRIIPPRNPARVRTLQIMVALLVAISLVSAIAIGMPNTNAKNDSLNESKPSFRKSDNPTMHLPIDKEKWLPIMAPEPSELPPDKDDEQFIDIDVYDVKTKKAKKITKNFTKKTTLKLLGSPGSLPSELILESPIGYGDRIRVTPTTDYPWRTIVKLRMWFPSGQYMGSGFIIDDYHILTAGHCVYDPNLNEWAEYVEVIPALDEGYMPFYHAWATQISVNSYWYDYGSYEDDFAIVTLDRNIGDFTGWMGLDTALPSNLIYSSIVNTAGYPGDLDGGGNMYFDSDLGAGADLYNHWYWMDTRGGQSGSPVWYYDDPFRYVLSIVAYETLPVYPNFGTRLSEYWFDFIDNVRGGDTPPTDYANLIDDGQDWSGFGPVSVTAGVTNFDVWSDIRNIGTSDSGIFYVSYYASIDAEITTSDYLIGVDEVTSITPFTWADSDWSGTFPNIPAGTYYVGWIIDSTGVVPEPLDSGEGNNVVYKDSYQLTVESTALISYYTNPHIGSITFDGIPYLNGQSDNYDTGSYTVTANAPTGYTFHHWDYDNIGEPGVGVYVPNIMANPVTATVSGDGWLKAVYEALITFRTEPSNVGSISYSGNIYSDGQSIWEVNLPPDYSNKVTISANPLEGYTFSHWETTGRIWVGNTTSIATDLTVNGTGVLTAHARATYSSNITNPDNNSMYVGPISIEFELSTESEGYVFNQSDPFDRIDLEIEYTSDDGLSGWGIVQWSTSSQGLSLESNDHYINRVVYDPKNQEGVAPPGFTEAPYGNVTIRLVHWKFDGAYTIGEFGVKEVETNFIPRARDEVEDLILEGNEKLIIENCVYNHSGNIIVRDNASLILRNATLALYWPSFHEYDISFQGSSYFESFNSTITDIPSSYEGGGYYLFMMDSSFANITSSRFHYPATLLDARGQNVTVNIRDSHLDNINIGSDSKVEINNSQANVHIWSGSPNVTIRDSKHIGQILIQFTGTAYADLSLQPGYHSYWSLQKNETISNCDMEVTIFNSTVSGWTLYSYNQPDINVKDSTLHAVVGRAEASFNLENVTVTSRISSEDNSSITLRDSTIKNLDTYDSSKVQMVNTSVDIDSQVNVFHESEIYVGWYLDATAINEAGTIEGASVEVYTMPEASLIDSKLTDEDGLARFDLWEKVLRANDTDIVNNYNISCEYQGVRLSEEILLTGNYELLFDFTGTHQYSISGMVFFSSTPLDNILVELTKDGEEIPILNTNTSQGFYSFSNVIPGLYWVKAYGPTEEYRPYISYRVEVIDQNVTKNIDLPKLLTLLSPENKANVTTSRPTFSWESFPNASRYSISVHEVSNWTWSVWADTQSTNHTLQTELSYGKEYGWSIYAYDANDHLIGSAWPWWSFKISTSACVSVGSAVIAPGYIIDVPVNMSHVTKITGLGFDLYWNPDVININGIRLSDDLSPSTNSLTVNIDPALGKAVVALINTHAPDYLTWEDERTILIVDVEAIGLHGNSCILDLEDVEVTDAETWIPSPVSNVEDGLVTIRNLGGVHGYVTYSFNGAPLEGATVELSRYGSALNTTVTGVEGEYGFLDVLLGGYNLTVSHERVLAGLQYTTFWDASASVDVIPGEMAEVDLSLLICGDLNGNGEVDIGDVAKTANMYVGNIPEEVDLTDFNGNGGLDIGDVAKLANYYVGNVDEV